jgi:phosphatidylglycerol---prolipoprotein diacylglyceryl transferase
MMMMILNFITWNVSPELFSIGPLTIRYYGLFFALAFAVGYKIMEYVYKKEGLPQTETDRISMYMIFGVVIGARLGHVLFYQPGYYFTHPLDILKIWEGGLASHGAAIGILIAIYLYSRSKIIPGYQWVLDRIILTVAIGGVFVRMGNLMNSEIYGHETNVPWAFIFVRDPDSGNLPRHPTQIYEAIGYLITFIILFSYYKRRGNTLRPGRLFGLFLILLFGTRFIVEFFKEKQVGFEQGLLDTFGLNMGQLLSVPFIIIGLFILVRSFRIDSTMKI